MEDEKKPKTKSVDSPCNLGMFWFAGWLFTLGYIHPTFWKGVLALVMWPYYLGVTISL